MTPERLMSVVEAHQTSIREGTDSLVALYCWRRQSGDDVAFASAVQDLVQRQFLEIIPGVDMRFRLTVQGFEQISKVTMVLAEDRPDPGHSLSWDGAYRQDAAGTPSEWVDALCNIFSILNATPERAFAADTLLRIWTIEGKNGGDLRVAIDQMISDGDLKAERAGRTAFRLTAQGASKR